MSLGNVNLVTGYKGQAHITAEDTAALNASIFGSGQYVLPFGNRLAASATTNNNIRVLDGDIMMQGRHIRLAENSYLDLTIDSGTTGKYRNDLIVARYTKNTSTGVEDCSLVVIKGTEAASDPADPAYTAGELLTDHDVLNDMPLWRVPLNGINVQPLVCLFEEWKNGSDISAEDIGAATENHTHALNGNSITGQLPASKIADGAIGTGKIADASVTLSKLKNISAESIGGMMKSGGTFTGSVTVNGIVLTPGVDYGTSFPENPEIGRLFFKVEG